MAIIRKGKAIEVRRALAMAAALGILISFPAIAETTDAEAALKAITGYRIGQDPQTVAEIEQLIRSVNSRTDPGRAAAQSELAAKIADTLASRATPAAKEFLCRQIATLAGEKQVPVLASLLLASPGGAEARVADAARGALELIPGPAPDAALLKALGKTKGSVKAGIIDSLGARRSQAAVGALIPLLNDSDSTVASAAVVALEKIGGAEAEKQLGEALSKAQGARRAQIADVYMKCADRRLGAGELAEATAIYTRLYVPSEALPIRETALIGLVLSDPKGITLAEAALGSSEPDMQRTALKLIRELPGSSGTTVITEQLGKVSPSLQVYLLDALADRGDRSAVGAVERAAQSQDESVRVAAVRTLGVLGANSQAKLNAQELVQHPQYKWQQTEGSIALLNHDRTVWQLNYGKDVTKPYFHPLALTDGMVLTVLSPRDHPWHRGMWFSWKMINNVNYWEEDRKTGLCDGRTEVVDAKIVPRDDHSADILLTLTYHLPDKPPVLTEKRKIVVSAPDEEGRYTMDWESVFTAGDQDVLLQGGTAGGGYAGLGVRFSEDTNKWRLIDSEGRVDLPGGFFAKNTHGQHARWMDFSVVDPTTDEIGGVAILQHPSCFRFPSYWHNNVNETFPLGYFSPAPLWAEPYTLPAGKSLKLSYCILIHPGRGVKDQLEAAWTAFSNSKE